MADDTAGKQPAHLREDLQFRRGQSGNPAGRPKGSRNKLGEDFLAALHADFETHGAEVIARVRDERPDQYLKVVASILPKQITGEDGPLLPVTRIELVALTEDDGADRQRQSERTR